MLQPGDDQEKYIGWSSAYSGFFTVDRFVL